MMATELVDIDIIEAQLRAWSWNTWTSLVLRSLHAHVLCSSTHALDLTKIMGSSTSVCVTSVNQSSRIPTAVANTFAMFMHNVRYT